jgi:hypothetical protein
MPYMFGVAQKIKQSRFVSKLHSLKSKKGKKKIFRGRVPKKEYQPREKTKDYTIIYILSVFTFIILSAILLSPSLGLGAVIVPVVLVSTFIFIILAVKSLFKK